MIQTQVVMMEVEDVAVDTRLLWRSTNGQKPLPKLDLPARIRLQKASKVKQIWELWSVERGLSHVHME